MKADDDLCKATQPQRPDGDRDDSGSVGLLNGPSTAVVCRQVTKEFGDGDSRVFALRGIDLEVYGGELTLLVGPSGCGKTTLISIIAGLLDPTAGALEVLGEDLSRMRGGQLVDFRGENVGFVFQQYNLLPALTAAENAAVPLIIAGRPRRTPSPRPGIFWRCSR